MCVAFHRCAKQTTRQAPSIQATLKFSSATVTAFVRFLRFLFNAHLLIAHIVLISFRWQFSVSFVSTLCSFNVASSMLPMQRMCMRFGQTRLPSVVFTKRMFVHNSFDFHKFNCSSVACFLFVLESISIAFGLDCHRMQNYRNHFDG